MIKPPVMGWRPSRGRAPRRYLVALVSSGWKYDTRLRAFVSRSERFGLRGRLPKYTRIGPLDPELALRDPRRLKKHERDLARTINIIVGESEDAADWLAEVRSWPCVESAWLSPDVAPP